MIFFFLNTSVFQASNSFPVSPFFLFNSLITHACCFRLLGGPGNTAKILELERSEEAGTEASKFRSGVFEADGNCSFSPFFFQFFNFMSFVFGSPGGQETGLKF